MTMRKKQFFLSIFLLMGLLSYAPTSHAMISRLFRGIFGCTEEVSDTPKIDQMSLSKRDFGVEFQDNGWQDYGTFFTNENKREAKNFPEKKITVGTNVIKAKVNEYKSKKIAQFDVLNQFDVNGGGYASCGYQTIKNGIVTILALLGKDIPNYVKDLSFPEHLKEKLPKNLKTKLNDVGLVKQFFGNICGRWRESISKKRRAHKLKCLLDESCTNCVRDPGSVVDPNSRLKKNKVAWFYRKALGDLATAIAKEVVFEKKEFSSDLDNVQKRLFELCETLCKKKNKDDVDQYYTTTDKTNRKIELSEYLCKKEFAKYIDFEKLKKTLKENVKSTVNSGSERLSTDWLDGHEIETLIELEKKKGMLKGIKNVSCLVCGDVSLMGTDFDINKEKLMKAVKKTLIDPDHKVLFCVGTMKNKLETLGATFGHWFPLIWSNNWNYTMDSLGNKSRLEDEHVKKILDTFETFRKSFKVIPQGAMGFSRQYKVPMSIHVLQNTGLFPKKPIQE